MRLPALWAWVLVKGLSVVCGMCSWKDPQQRDGCTPWIHLLLQLYSHNEGTAGLSGWNTWIVMEKASVLSQLQVSSLGATLLLQYYYLHKKFRLMSTLIRFSFKSHEHFYICTWHPLETPGLPLLFLVHSIFCKQPTAWHTMYFLFTLGLHMTSFVFYFLKQKCVIVAQSFACSPPRGYNLLYDTYCKYTQQSHGEIMNAEYGQSCYGATVMWVCNSLRGYIILITGDICFHTEQGWFHFFATYDITHYHSQSEYCTNKEQVVRQSEKVMNQII